MDASLRNKNGTWLKYSAADFNFTNLDGDTITWPDSPDKDWAKFNIVNLGGNRTWPMPTAAFAATNIDLRDKGEQSGQHPLAAEPKTLHQQECLGTKEDGVNGRGMHGNKIDCMNLSNLRSLGEHMARGRLVGKAVVRGRGDRGSEADWRIADSRRRYP